MPLCLAFWSCEYVRPTLNAPLIQYAPAGGYRLLNLAPPEADNSDGLFLAATFSGGEVRASALAFGVLRELARHEIAWQGRHKRLLDELDVIFALSGGSFTAAYCALYGDRLFDDFEYRFLRKDWDTELRTRVLWSPSNWIRLWSPYFGRAHLLAELLDEALFDRKTYADLAARRQRPLLAIHATDMTSLSRFEFTLKNYAGQCRHQPLDFLERARREGGVSAQVASEALSYLDVKKRPYVHLVDGGLADNMALRGIIEGVGLVGGHEQLLKLSGVKNIQKLVVLAVNAETSPDALEYRSDHVPIMSQAMRSMIDVPINRYSFDTVMLIRLALKQWQEDLRDKPRGVDSPFAPDAKIHFINASLAEIVDPDERLALMKIPTSLYLTEDQIDRLPCRIRPHPS
ncbi:lipoprotein [Nitrospira sp. KM1]|uniref:patatin-like phospholipase family protein n=1 Tax=Nitrospira sp. KM1 TaxID=1936990 RepID=UPI0013A7187A|nr:patatin-like phospholipase family protein [Nitrospira sp. KM1]BCA53772.1 lipoprotein [Nitrospira sp. KM1]